MRVYLQGYETMAIARSNYADVWDVYASNPEYFMTHKGRAARLSDILETFDRLVDGFDPAKQYFVGFWQNDCCVAVLELLPNFPNDGELWLSEIIVHGNHHGKGLGKKIVAAVLAAAAGFKRIKLGTDEHLIAFWKGLGFNKTHQSEDFIYFEQEVIYNEGKH